MLLATILRSAMFVLLTYARTEFTLLVQMLNIIHSCMQKKCAENSLRFTKLITKRSHLSL